MEEKTIKNESIEPLPDAAVLAIKEEYEKKLEEQRAELQEHERKALEEQENRHIAQLRALMTGRNEIADAMKDKAPEIEDEETRITNNLLKKFVK